MIVQVRHRLPARGVEYPRWSPVFKFYSIMKSQVMVWSSRGGKAPTLLVLEGFTSHWSHSCWKWFSSKCVTVFYIEQLLMIM